MLHVTSDLFFKVTRWIYMEPFKMTDKNMLEGDTLSIVHSFYCDFVVHIALIFLILIKGVVLF